jgi:hypothetical protein
MKRVLLSAVVVGLFAGPALAGLYTLDTATALQFTNWSASSVSAGDLGARLVWATTSSSVYGGTMQGKVGWVGFLMDDYGVGDNYATMTIGAGNDAGLSGSYTGYQAFLANDDDDPWDVQLFIQTAAGKFVSGFTTLAGGSNAVLTLNTAFDFGDVKDFGFEVRGDFSGGSPSNPDAFKISAVPIPGAALLGALGLFAAGLKLRRFM